MLYKIFIIVYSFSLLSGQSLFNRWIGTDPFIGSTRSTAMGNTHLLNSTGSQVSRYNPAGLSIVDSKIKLNFQLNRASVFERWSMPVRDSFGEFLTHADYVANEFNYYDISLGIVSNFENLQKNKLINKIGFGLNYAPLTHFTYNYSEEVRGSYRIEDGEYASKDPVVGYQNLSTDGNLMVASLGSGIQFNLLNKMNLSVGLAINFIQSTKLIDLIEVDTLYSQVSNLTTQPDWNEESDLPNSNFVALSSNLKLNSNIIVGVSWEGNTNITSNEYHWEVDTTNGLFKFWDGDSFVVNGINYIKPSNKSFAISYNSNNNEDISINFEINQISYNEHTILQNYKQFKIGFEYITQMGTPIRGGLVYRTSNLQRIKPGSIFTFGSGKTINNLIINYAGTYAFQSYNYPDLFIVEEDIRPENDLIRDSQLHLQLSIIYNF